MSNYKEILASSIWFSDIPEKLQQAMFDNMRIKHLKAGQQLHAKGEQGVGFTVFAKDDLGLFRLA